MIWLLAVSPSLACVGLGVGHRGEHLSEGPWTGEVADLPMGLRVPAATGQSRCSLTQDGADISA